MQFQLKDKVAVIIPCYRVTKHIINVINNIPAEVAAVYVVDDACPDGSGALVDKFCSDQRIKVLYNAQNLGVGGAMITGYLAAADDGMQILVKIDGDGQMDPTLIDLFVRPILTHSADYTKGNRFFKLETVKEMPKSRVFGNAALSFMSKFSTGYWNIFDPTNGYTAIHASVAQLLPFEKLSKRYFFETDMLFRLCTLRAVVVDIPMTARYADEVSNLEISRVWKEFFIKHISNTVKRIFYNYWLRNFSAASLQFALGLVLFFFGLTHGLTNWYVSTSAQVETPIGTVMIATLSLLFSLQLVLAFLSYDINSVPSDPLHPKLPKRSLRSDVKTKK
jgi:dolichol-phosphate mannosyltransferase